MTMRQYVENISDLNKNDFVEWRKELLGAGNLFVHLLAVCQFKKAAAKGRKKGEEKIQNTIRFYDGFLEVQGDCGRKKIIPYQDIRKIKSTEHLHILQCKKNQDVIMRKESFTKGNIDEAKMLVYPKKKIG